MKEFCHNYDMMEAIRLRGSYQVEEVYGGEMYVGVGAEVESIYEISAYI